MASFASTDVEFRSADPDGFFEVIDDQLVEQPPMGTESVWIVNRIGFRLAAFVDQEANGTVVSEMLFTLREAPLLRRRPDVAFVSSGRWPLDRPIPRDNGWEVVPDLAVEVVSPSDPFEDVLDRVHDFLDAGSALVWLVLPKLRQVYLYDGTASIRVLRKGDDLDGGSVLPGFRCPVGSCFPPIGAE
ncbi:Uma2 family endonuclease [Tautonia sp. JC769]|uniref:Uma2 family endonuclease n=1 Tax=Tautonia sp. JC769 TaxID=3232135 RepID=UPI00345A1220